MPGQVVVIMAALHRHISRITARIGTEVVIELALRTPVDTGWAASNWIATIGEPRTDTVGSKSGVSFAAQKLGLARIAPGLYNARKGPIYIVNNVPYIVLLNLGTSKQASSMFVEAAIANAISRVVRAAA